jgi:cytochrome c553
MPVERRWRALRAGLVAALAAASACSAAQEAPPVDRLALCAACHGPQGRSQQPAMPSLAGQPRLFTETQLVLIREGLREVPEMATLMHGMSDAEIGVLAGYFGAQPAPPPAARGDEQRWQAGRQAAQLMHCGSCHLADFAGQQQVPRLAGQQEAYLIASMRQFRDKPGPGRDTVMAATLRGLPDAQIESLAYYLARYRPQ